jgi:hypothetical protein
MTSTFVAQMKSMTLLQRFATLWTLFSALAKKEKITAQNEKKAVIATPKVTKSAERTIFVLS